VYVAGELQAAMKKDQSVQRHYSGFDASHLRFVTLGADCYRHVSFRLGDQIYWTRTKLRIPKGEVLFTDGSNYARTRCGNRLAEAVNPQLTSILEPPPEVLSAPPFRLSDAPQALRTGAALGQERGDGSGDLPLATGPISFPNTIPNVITGASPSSASAGAAPGGGVIPWLPLGLVAYGSAGKPTGSGPVPVAPPPVMPVPIPEPDEVILVAAFLSGVWMIARPRSGLQRAARHIR
jgi:hypothetical protein